MSKALGEREAGICHLSCEWIVAGRRGSIDLTLPRAGDMGMGLCLCDIILLSITRIWGRGLSGMAQDGMVAQGALLFSYFIISLFQTHCQPPHIKVHAEQGWNTTLDFPRIKTVFIAIFLCASIHIVL